MAKRLDSRYEPGRRTGAWVKIKHTRRQELVIGGWLPGRGAAHRADRRAADGRTTRARDERRLRYAGRVGTGFTERTLTSWRPAGAAAPRPSPVRPARPSCPATPCSWSPCWWPRSSSASGPPRASCARRRTRACATTRTRSRWSASAPAPREPAARRRDAGRAARPERARRRSPIRTATPEALFESVEPLPDGALAVVADGRRLKLSNWDKVLFPQTGFTKGDLIAYYARVAPSRAAAPARPAADPQALSQRGRRAVLLREAVAVAPARVGSDRADRRRSTTRWPRTAPTLIWLANLADIELHTSLSLADRPERPTMLVFDLDPGRAGRDRRVLRGGAGAARAVRPARAGERGQDLGLQGDADVRPAQRPTVDLRADQAVRARGSPSCSSSGCPSWSSRG